LIIDDSNTSSSETKLDTELFSPVISESIPDSSISFFDEEPQILSTETVAENINTQVLTEDIMIQEESTSLIENIPQEIIPMQESSDLFAPISEDKTINNESEEIETEVKEKADPNAILIDAIANLQKLLK